MKWELCFFVIIGLILSQNTVNCINNIGLKLYNLSRRASNGSDTKETCIKNCQYYLNLSLGAQPNPDSSFSNYSTLSWEIAPKKIKKFALYEQLTENYEINPLRKVVDCWPREAVLLVDICSKDTTPVKREQLRINSTPRRPINDMKKIDELQLMPCEGGFCLGMSLYIWCDDLNCKATLKKCPPKRAVPSPTSSAVHPQTTSEIYETRTTHESLKSSKVYTSAGASQKLGSTMYGTSSIMAKRNTYKTTTAFDSSTSVFVETSNYDKIVSTMHSPSWSMVTSSEYKTKTTNTEPLKSVSVETSNDDKIMSTMYRPSLSTVTINTYKTKTINDIESSKSVFVEPSNDEKIMSTMYSPSWSMETTNSHKTETINGIESSNDESSTTSSCQSKGCKSEVPKPALRDTSKEVFKRWWFRLCIVVAALLLIWVALIMVKVKDKQRKSRKIGQTATSKCGQKEAFEIYGNAAYVSMETFKK